MPGRDAEVRQATVFQVVALQQQLGRAREADGHRWRQRRAVDELLVAVAVRQFTRASKTPVHRLANAAHVDFAAAPCGVRQAQGQVRDIHARFFGDAVDQATRGTAAVQHGGRPLDHFQPLHIRQVAEIQGVIAEAVDKLVADGREAADKHLVTLAVARGQAHARNVLHDVLDRHGVLVADDRGRHHVDRLRHIAQGHFRLGAAGGRAGDIAILVLRCRHGDGGQAFLRPCRQWHGAQGQGAQYGDGDRFTSWLALRYNSLVDYLIRMIIISILPAGTAKSKAGCK